jgi:eukaryotic translation initiation factor 2C
MFFNIFQLLRDVYIKKKQPLPQNILVMRDGVSEGMFVDVKQIEVQGLLSALKVMCGNTPMPKVTVVVSQKRHNTRIFTQKELGNPPPGTLVDTQVVDSLGPVDTDPNFYLLSHTALQGTARPTHYHVLHDEMKWPDMELKNFIFAQCCLHQGSPRPLSYPAPVYFADRLAERAHKCYFNKEKNYWDYFGTSVKKSEVQSELSWNTFSKSLARPIMI